MIKDYPNLSLKLAAAAILMIASISAVVLLYKDSQKRSLLYSHAYSTNRFTPSETSGNTYPTIGQANNQRAYSSNNFPSFKGTQNNTDYTPTETVVPAITSTSIGTTSQNSTSYSSQQSNSNMNIGVATISNNSRLTQLTSKNTTNNNATSNLSSTSIFADNNSGMASDLSGNGRMLVDPLIPPDEPGVPIGNGTYILLLLVGLYTVIKFRINKTKYIQIKN